MTGGRVVYVSLGKQWHFIHHIGCNYHCCVFSSFASSGSAALCTLGLFYVIFMAAWKTLWSYKKHAGTCSLYNCIWYSHNDKIYTCMPAYDISYTNIGIRHQYNNTLISLIHFWELFHWINSISNIYPHKSQKWIIHEPSSKLISESLVWIDSFKPFHWTNLHQIS